MTVTNSSASSLSISKISASGNYTATGNGATPCGSTLVAGAKCTLAVTFAPSINGTIKGAITIANSTTVSPQVYNLSGTGVLPLTFSPASITFAGRPVGTTSPPVTVSLKNNQSTALTITFATSGQYKAVPSGTSPCGASLAGSATCTLSVTFTPAAAGSIKGVSTFIQSNRDEVDWHRTGFQAFRFPNFARGQSWKFRRHPGFSDAFKWIYGHRYGFSERSSRRSNFGPGRYCCRKHRHAGAECFSAHG